MWCGCVYWMAVTRWWWYFIYTDVRVTRETWAYLAGPLMGWDCETVANTKQPRYINTCRNSQGRQVVYAVMAVLCIFSSGKPIYSGGETSIMKLEGHGQSPPPPPPHTHTHTHTHPSPQKYKMAFSTKVFAPPVPMRRSWLDWKGQKLSCTQAHGWRRDRQTDAGTTIHEGKNWPQLKITEYVYK